MIKIICKKPTAKSYSMVRNLEALPALTTSSQLSAGNPSQSSKARKRKKGIQIGKEEVKLFVCR